MKNFKSLILGSAAGMLAVAGAQAADLPVKAKPVEYVKVCSAYGAGFYYIPGTDICLRVGGYIWSDFSVNNRGIANYMGTGASRDRTDDWTAFRVRQNLILDARTNTEYGTLRSYFSGGFQWDTSTNGQVFSQANTGNSSWYWNSAFIQFAGFTFGIANSFFDFDPSMVMDTSTTKSTSYSPMIAYTAQLGSGVSATIAVEDGTVRREQISFATAAGATTLGGFGGAGVNQYSAQFMPDIIANLRVDQAWGSAQIAGAVHQVKSNAAGVAAAAPNNTSADPLGSVKYGYAFMGGLNFKLPSIGAKDSFQIEGVWSKGALAFTGINSSPYSNVTAISYVTGGTGPVLDTMDAFWNPVSNSLDLTKAYSVNASFRHFWTPTLRSSFMYGYLKVDNAASANAAGVSDGRLHQAAVNLIWSPVKNLDIGTELMYNDLKTSNGALVAGTPTGNNGSNDWWGGNFRVTRYW